MSTRLLLDGQDLRALMLRVRDEMGPGATIVRAERVRTGGIAGFFAREHYELTVEVPDPPERPPPRSRPAPPLDAARPDGQIAEAVGLEALLAAADEADHAPRLSTAGDSFAQVLASVQQITADRPADRPTGQTTDPAATPQSATRQSATPEPVRPAWAPATPPSLSTGRTDPAATTAATGPAVPAAAPAVAPAAVPDVEPEPAPGPDGDTDLADTASASALLELGVPTRLLAGFDPAQAVPLARLARRFDRPTLRLAPGSVVVVAGPAELAVSTAVAMARRVGLAPQDVVLAGEVDPIPGHGRRVQTTAAAARIRARVGSDTPTIVALGVAGTAAGALLLSAFDPDEAWAALDARLRGVQLRRWLSAVGARRPFDAVAVGHVLHAQSPGTVLNLGVPVGWLDGLPASPVVWTALLAERLQDDAQGD